MADKKPPKPKKPTPTKPYPGLSGLAKRGEGPFRESAKERPPRKPPKKSK